MLRKRALKGVCVIFLLCLFCLSCFAPVKAKEEDVFNFDEFLGVDLQANQLTMSDAIKLALLNNPKITLERALVEEKTWSIKENKSYLYPHLYVSQNFVASNNPVNAFMMKLNQRNFNFTSININNPGTEANFSTRLGANFVLFDRSIYSKVDISKLELEIQKQIGKQALYDLVKSVRKAYLDVKLAQEKVASVQSTLEFANAHFKAVSNKKEAGNASKSDFLSAKVRLTTAEDELKKTKNDLNLSWIILSEIVGDESIVGYDLVEEMHENYPVDDVDKLVKYSYLHRPEISTIEIEKQKVLVDLKAAENTGALTINTQGEWGVDTILDDRAIAQSFTAAVYLNKTLFDGGLRTAKIKQAKANIDRRNAEIDQIYRQIKLEVVQNYLSLINAQERLKMTDTLMEDAEESLRAYSERYLVGLSNNVEVESAQSNLSNAKLLRWHALYDLEMAVINLQRAMGLPLADILSGQGLMITKDQSDATKPVVDTKKKNMIFQRFFKEKPKNEASKGVKTIDKTINKPNKVNVPSKKLNKPKLKEIKLEDKNKLKTKTHLKPSKPKLEVTNILSRPGNEDLEKLSKCIIKG